MAEKIYVAGDTISNWELNYSSPEVRFMPQIIAFLGYDPLAFECRVGFR